MSLTLLSLLAQVDQSKLDTDAPILRDPASSMVAWVIAAVLLVGILLITFKTSRRNHLENE